MGIINTDVDIPADLIQYSFNAEAKVNVISGVGDGNMNVASLKARKEASSKGVVVVV